jgi:hypothetical protein
MIFNRLSYNATIFSSHRILTSSFCKYIYFLIFKNQTNATSNTNFLKNFFFFFNKQTSLETKQTETIAKDPQREKKGG